MGGPESGKYFIQLDAHHKPLIGVDFGPQPIKPVVTEGNNRVVSPLIVVQHRLYQYHPFDS